MSDKPLEWAFHEIPSEPIMQINTTGSEYLLIIKEPGTSADLVRITYEGLIEYGEGYVPEDAARIFWEAIAKAFEPDLFFRSNREVFEERFSLSDDGGVVPKAGDPTKPDINLYRNRIPVEDDTEGSST